MLQTLQSDSVGVTGLSARFGEREVLADVSFEVGAHQAVCIVGPGGSGKSTLLSILVDRAPHSLAVEGTVAPVPRRAFLGQRPRVDPHRVSDVLTAGAATTPRLAELTPTELLWDLWGDCRPAIERLGSALDQPLTRLDPATARLAILTALLATHHPCLVLDEPEAGCDREVQAWVSHVLRRQRERRRLVVASHHLGLVREVADHVVFLLDGVVVTAAATDEFFDAPRDSRTGTYIRFGS